MKKRNYILISILLVLVIMFVALSAKGVTTRAVKGGYEKTKLKLPNDLYTVDDFCVGNDGTLYVAGMTETDTRAESVDSYTIAWSSKDNGKTWNSLYSNYSDGSYSEDCLGKFDGEGNYCIVATSENDDNGFKVVYYKTNGEIKTIEVCAKQLGYEAIDRMAQVRNVDGDHCLINVAAYENKATSLVGQLVNVNLATGEITNSYYKTLVNYDSDGEFLNETVEGQEVHGMVSNLGEIRHNDKIYVLQSDNTIEIINCKTGETEKTLYINYGNNESNKDGVEYYGKPVESKDGKGFYFSTSEGVLYCDYDSGIFENIIEKGMLFENNYDKDITFVDDSFLGTTDGNNIYVLQDNGAKGGLNLYLYGYDKDKVVSEKEIDR